MEWPVGPFAILVLLAAAAQTDGAVLDDQIVERGTPPELTAIGAVTGGSALRHATGFLVGECEVLTVKHAAGWIDKAIGRRMRFAQAGQGGQHSFGTVIAVGSLDLIENWDSPNRLGDWMVMRLDRCFGRKFGFVELSAAPVYLSGHWAPGSPDLQLAGFPAGRRWQDGVTRDPHCRIRVIRDGLYLNDCATRPVNSGSPLFAIEGAGALRHMIVFAMQSLGETKVGKPSIS